MEHSPDRETEPALKAVIRHLVLSFPNAAILSREVGDRYHVFVIVPYGGGPEKTLQVERAWLVESTRSIEVGERVLRGSTCHGCFRRGNGTSCGMVVLRSQSEPAEIPPAKDGQLSQPAVRCAMAQSRFQVRPDHRIPCSVRCISKVRTPSAWASYGMYHSGGARSVHICHSPPAKRSD